MFVPGASAFERMTTEELQIAAVAILDNEYADLVWKEINSQLHPETAVLYQPFVAPQRNILLRVVSLQAQLYARPPRRTGEKPDLTDALRKYAPDLDMALQEAQRHVYAAGDCIVQVYPDADEKQVKFDVIPAKDYKKIFDRGSLRAIRVKQNGEWVDHLQNGDLMIDGKKTEAGKYGTRMLVPFSLGWCSERKPWAIGMVRDLIKVTVLVGVLEAFRARGHFLRSQRIPVLAPNEYDETLSAGDNVPVDQTAVFRGNLTAVSLADEEDRFLESIRGDLADIAASRGISEMTLYRSIKDPNEFQAVTKELAASWAAGAELFRRQEKALLRAVISCLAVDFQLPLAADQKVMIDYLEPMEQQQTPMEALQSLEKGIALGVDSVERFVALRNPDLTTDEDVQEYIQACIDSRAEMVKKMRELNAPKNPAADPGQNPEVNGADGPLAVSREILSKEELETEDESDV